MRRSQNGLCIAPEKGFCGHQIGSKGELHTENGTKKRIDFLGINPTLSKIIQFSNFLFHSMLAVYAVLVETTSLGHITNMM